MKTILIYGDSNTWGQMAFGDRYQYENRWPNILQKKLGLSYHVIDSGISGRTAASYPVSEKRHRGDDAFEFAYLTSYPFSMIIIALGTNDLHKIYDASSERIVKSLLWYQEEVAKLQEMDERKFGKASDPKILYVLPPNFDASKSPERSEEKRQSVIELFKKSGANYIEVNNLEMSEDGVHFSEGGHNVLAQIVFKKVKEML